MAPLPNNSNPLYGDFVMPNQMTRNKFLHPKEGVGKNICVDRTLHPLQSTAVNRGYMDGVLDNDGKLVSFTSACSPMIYQGNDFGGKYNGNAFVCAPEINAIKRITLSEKNLEIEGLPAWNNKEFLITTDQGFRPVNLNNAPDGSFYITDMHRGIIQHKVYMTAYLKKQIETRQLDTIINSGRIFRISQKGDKSKNIDLENKYEFLLTQINKSIRSEDEIKPKETNQSKSKVDILPMKLENIKFLIRDNKSTTPTRDDKSIKNNYKELNIFILI